MASSSLVLALVLAVGVSPATEVSGSQRPPARPSDARSAGPAAPRSTFLWRVDVSPPSFFFGTIHVPYVRVWDSVSPVAKRAFGSARHLFLELDLTDHDTVRALSACQLLPDGQHLSQVIPSDIFLRLRAYLGNIEREMHSWLTPDQRSRGFTSDFLFHAATSNWERKRPVWVMMMLNTLTQSDVASRGVPVLDLHLSNLARRAGKRVGAIETPEEQCGPINDLTSQRVIFALNQTLSYYEGRRLILTSSPRQRQEVEDMGFTTDQLIKQYRSGDIASMQINQNTFQIPAFHNSLELTPQEQSLVEDIDDYFQTHLVESRNHRMAARVVDLLVNKPDKSYFFAFGAGHFVGESNVLDFVRSAGFRVDAVGPAEELDLVSLRRRRPHRVQGTFDDLPDEEKTKALLQFLQYKQQSEDGNSTLRFQEMVGGVRMNTVGLRSKSNVDNEDDPDEKTIEESLKIWYGLNEDKLLSRASCWRQTRLVIVLAALVSMCRVGS